MELIDQLQQTLILKGVEKSDLELLLSKMERRSYPTGTVIFERGDPGNEMFIILAGRIRIYTYDEYNNALTLRHYGVGEIFGELSPLDQQTRSASAAAAESLDVMVLSREQLLAFVYERPGVGLSMMRSLASRVRYTTDYLTKVMEWVHRLSKGEYEAALHDIAASECDIENLITSFVTMVQSVQEREQALQGDAEVMRIEINEAVRNRQVQEIAKTEYFEELADKAHHLRDSQDAPAKLDKAGDEPATTNDPPAR
jgi:CRP-like cAMP-binding protein